jgi:two-component system NtrC family sensor kinase
VSPSATLAKGQSAPLAVLVVDDVEANLVAMAALLESTGAELVLARSGEDALRQLLRRQFAVMLLDVQMPGMDGYEVARHARSNAATRDVPIIFLTASDSSDENIARGYGSGAVDYLIKPINAVILRSKLQVFLELHRGRRELHDAKTSLEQANQVLRQAYSDLQSAQAQLVQSAKMASLGQLVAGVAHEINNPLSFVSAHLETVQACLATVSRTLPEPLPSAAQPAWDRANARLNEMAMGVTRMRDLVLKLRTFSRLDEGERSVISLKECLDSVLTILTHRTHGVAVTLECCEPDRIDCYPGTLNQALLNVISNALDAVMDVEERAVAITTRADDGWISIAVRDSGLGLAKGASERLFEPFFTTKPPGSGTGLGLSITYSIVKKHGGVFTLENAVGGGALAVIRLPIQVKD